MYHIYLYICCVCASFLHLCSVHMYICGTILGGILGWNRLWMKRAWPRIFIASRSTCPSQPRPSLGTKSAAPWWNMVMELMPVVYLLEERWGAQRLEGGRWISRKRLDVVVDSWDSQYVQNAPWDAVMASLIHGCHSQAQSIIRWFRDQPSQIVIDHHQSSLIKPQTIINACWTSQKKFTETLMVKGREHFHPTSSRLCAPPRL